MSANCKRGGPGIFEAIGRTPLIRLHRLSEATGCEILGKAEFMNPGGSVKDRTALGLIVDAEERGILSPGGAIVEGTAGNTGIGLTLLGNARGYRTIIVIPDNQSPEKIQSLRAMGAEVRPVPQAPYSSAGNYNHVARRIAAETPGAWWADQFDNTANRAIHERTTGPEIWEQTGGRVSAFVASIGTGGTLSGATDFLRRQNPSIISVCADPMGAAMWSWFKHGHTRFDSGDSIAEGIGQCRVTKNVAGTRIDEAYRIPDAIAVRMLYSLLLGEGLFVSLSSAINVCGAARLAMDRGPGQTIVTVLCDSGTRYLSNIFNASWLGSKGLRFEPAPEFDLGLLRDLPEE